MAKHKGTPSTGPPTCISGALVEVLCRTDPEYTILPLEKRLTEEVRLGNETTDGVPRGVYLNTFQVLRAELLHEHPQTPADTCLAETIRCDRKEAFSI